MCPRGRPRGLHLWLDCFYCKCNFETTSTKRPLIIKSTCKRLTSIDTNVKPKTFLPHPFWAFMGLLLTKGTLHKLMRLFQKIVI